MTVFEHASTVVLPVYPEIAALKAVHSLLDYLTDTGSVGAKALFVLNNMFAKEILRLRDVENALGTKISSDLPYDPFLYLKAVNEGIPVVRGAPRTQPAERLPTRSPRSCSARARPRQPPPQPPRAMASRRRAMRRRAVCSAGCVAADGDSIPAARRAT